MSVATPVPVPRNAAPECGRESRPTDYEEYSYLPHSIQFDTDLEFTVRPEPRYGIPEVIRLEGSQSFRPRE